jgi:uncharacterized metal-binding protein
MQPKEERVPDGRTHDIITVATGAALAPFAYAACGGSANHEASMTCAGILVGAHLLSGLMFSPDLDLDSRIDDRWGVFFWIWRPYMWIVPHRNFWSHGLILPPLLRLLYFYLMVAGLLIIITWLLAQIGLLLPNYNRWLTERLVNLAQEYPHETLLFVYGFVTGGAVHSIADWLVTGGKGMLAAVGIRVKRDYSTHDRWRPRTRRRRSRSWL